MSSLSFSLDSSSSSGFGGRSSALSSGSGGSSSLSFSNPASWWASQFSDAAADDDEDNEEYSPFTSKEGSQKDSVVILINASKSMLERMPNDEIPILQCLHMAINQFKDKIISSRNDLLGVVFFGSRTEKGTHGFENVHVFLDLDEPSASAIKQLRAVVEDFEIFKRDIGSVDEDEDKESNFGNALWAVQQMFSATPRSGSKRIFIFTDKDNPNSDDSDVQDQAFTKAEDLAQLGVTSELFVVGPKTSSFDVGKFFNKIIRIEEDEMTGKFNFEPLETLQSLQDTVRRKEFKKRALVTCPFTIDGETLISVKMYCLIRELRKDSPEYLDAATNELLSCTTTWICQDSAAVLEDYQIKTYYPYGGTKVFITKEEMKEIKSFGEPGLMLMGFKPISSLKPYYNVKNSYFVYPDEERIRGSSKAFNALLVAMDELKQYAVCRFIMRKSDMPRFVALVPQRETFEENECQDTPPGFSLIFLPYADDIRKQTFPPQPVADDTLIESAKEIVTKLDLSESYSPDNFDNPTLSKHYAVLEALALDEPLEDLKEVDHTLPDTEGIERHCGDLIKEFKKLWEDKCGDFPPPAAKAPRKKAAPKRKRDDGEPIDYKDLASKNELSSLTLAELKAYCAQTGLPRSGKKALIVERIRSHLGFS